jgi:hypothetical protein
MDIVNKTQKPVAVPLPGGKKLRLGPGKTGQITPKAAEHPPVMKLVEEGVVEIVGIGKKSHGGSTSGVQGGTRGHSQGGGGLFRSGDR